MNHSELENYISLGRLIEASTSESIKESSSTKANSELLAFCKSKNLAPLLYSLYDQGLFEQIFPEDESAYFSKEYQKAWASNLRYDQIREELRNAILDNLSVECLFLDTTLRLRQEHGNKFLRSDRSIQILIPEGISKKNLVEMFRPMGFMKIYPDARTVARIYNKLNSNSQTSYFKRKEFIVSIGNALPVIFAESIDNHRLFERRNSFNEFGILCKNDDQTFNVLSFLEAIILGVDYSPSFFSCFLSKLGNDLIDLPIENSALRRVVKKTLENIEEIFKGNGQPSELFLLNGFTRGLDRAFLLQECKQSFSKRDLYRMIFNVEYI